MASDDEEIRTGAHGVARGFGRGLVRVLLLAAAVRAAYIVGAHADFPLTGDAWVFHHEGRFLASGRGLVDPVVWRNEHLVKQAADHPPLFVGLLAVAWLAGLQSELSQLLLNGAIGVATVALIALLARRLVGDRGGLIAGVIAALYPGLWAWNGQLLAESLATLLLVAVIMIAYRYLEDRSVRRAALLGAAVGVAALARPELLVLAVFIPATLAAHFRAGRGLAQLVRHGIVCVALLAAVVGPWTAWNLSRFRQPVLFGTGLGRSLASGTCPETISGPSTGFWFEHCIEAPMGVTADQRRDLDESQIDALYRSQALHVMNENRQRLPVVAVARVGRMFQFWAPLQQLRFDQLSENREWWVTGMAFATFYLLAAAATLGAVVLRRRRVRVYLLLLPVAVAAVGALLAFGTTRYRAAAEPSLVVLAAVAVDAVVRRRERRRGGPAAHANAAAVGAQPAGDEDRDDWDRWMDGGAGATAELRVPAAVASPAGPGGGARPGPPGAPGGPHPRSVDWWEVERERARWTGRAPDAEDEAARRDAEFWSREARPVRLPLIVAMVMTVMVGVGALGVWATVATGNRLPVHPVSTPTPALPPPN